MGDDNITNLRHAIPTNDCRWYNQLPRSQPRSLSHKYVHSLPSHCPSILLLSSSHHCCHCCCRSCCVPCLCSVPSCSRPVQQCSLTPPRARLRLLQPRPLLRPLIPIPLAPLLLPIIPIHSLASRSRLLEEVSPQPPLRTPTSRTRSPTSAPAAVITPTRLLNGPLSRPPTLPPPPRPPPSPAQSNHPQSTPQPAHSVQPTTTRTIALHPTTARRISQSTLHHAAPPTAPPLPHHTHLPLPLLLLLCPRPPTPLRPLTLQLLPPRPPRPPRRLVIGRAVWCCLLVTVECRRAMWLH